MSNLATASNILSDFDYLLIFGHLLTGSNYNDDEKKVVGGRNGYGAKLANIFSHKFIVECGDGAARKKFKMIWKKNMTTHG